MKNIAIKTTLRNSASAIVLGAILLPAIALADSDQGHNDSHMGNHMSEQGHMMSEQGQMMSGQQGMDQHMREVMGTGRINKVMADRHMVNIVHEPIAELEWPKMRMNFKTTEDVNLSDLKPGQEVTFKLQVKKDNSYVIKQIDVK